MARAGAPFAAGRGIALGLLALALAACNAQSPPDAAGGALLPALASRQDQVDKLQLRGAGGKPLVSLSRAGAEWRLAERDGFRADGARIGQYLAQLAQARRAEAKTSSEAMYPRIAVEDVADPGAGGTELGIAGKDIAVRLVLGKPHGITGGRYVRLAGERQAWLVDLDLGFDADPAAWLDRRLFAIPLARVERVRIRPRNSTGFALVRRDDRFRPDDAPAAAMRDSHAGDEIAALLESFEVEDVAAAAGKLAASQELDYELVDGAVITIAVHREGQRDWARVGARFDASRAAAWAHQAGRPAIAEEARLRVGEWSARFAGRKFLLPAALASTLMLDHSQILEGRPGAL